MGGGLPGFITLVQKFLIYSVANGRILTGAFYIPIGMLLSREKIPLKLSIVLMVGGFALNVATNNIISSSILVAVSAIGFFSVVEKINLKNSSFYPFVRNVSTYIYFLHMYIWTGYYTFKYGQRTYGLDSFMVTLIVSFIISVSFVYLWNKKKQRGHKNSTKHLGNVIIELPRND